ncbi:hypothetical protein BH09DEP1_BH09DEP1_1270 [soil metagenome]
MKHVLILNLLFINSACSGMAFFKNLKKKIETTFASVTNDVIAQPNAQETTTETDFLTIHGQNIKKERLVRYQSVQKENVNGAILSLLAAGIFKFNANQSHPLGDAYINFHMATAFSLGVAATCAYTFCVTPLPEQHLAQVELKTK